MFEQLLQEDKNDIVEEIFEKGDIDLLEKVLVYNENCCIHFIYALNGIERITNPDLLMFLKLEKMFFGCEKFTDELKGITFDELAESLLGFKINKMTNKRILMIQKFVQVVLPSLTET